MNGAGRVSVNISYNLGIGKDVFCAISPHNNKKNVKEEIQNCSLETQAKIQFANIDTKLQFAKS